MTGRLGVTSHVKQTTRALVHVDAGLKELWELCVFAFETQCGEDGLVILSFQVWTSVDQERQVLDLFALREGFRKVERFNCYMEPISDSLVTVSSSPSWLVTGLVILLGPVGARASRDIKP